MTPGARTQAVIEMLGQLLDSWQSEKRIPADKLIENYFKSHRYIGSKDRAYIGELAYWVLRHLAEVNWHVEHGLGDAPSAWRTPRAAVFAALLLRGEYTPQSIQSLTKDSKYSPGPLAPEEIRMCENILRQHQAMPDHIRLNYPEWMEPMLKARFGDEFEPAMRALNEQAATDLRVNTLKTTREQLQRDLRDEGFDAEPTPLSPVGLRLKKRAPIFTSKYFKQGHFEIQDEGSQLVALLADAKPGQKVIDFCAGAGGKTLAMAAAMKNKGRILAWDTSEKRLSQLAPRLRRAGVDNVQSHVISSEHDAFIKRHKGSADCVLVDAPCSGSGTWRRNPDLKWRFTQDDLQELLAVQRAILSSAARLVRPGGKLIYATCSILTPENEAQIENLLTDRNDFTIVCAEKMCDKNPSAGFSGNPGFLRITPHNDGVDGFFAASFVRRDESTID